MPRIEDEIKLDFADVLSEFCAGVANGSCKDGSPFLLTVRPKRSTIKSRAEVDLSRTYLFRNKREWTGVPIISANMDTTGRFEIAEKLAPHKCMVRLRRNSLAAAACHPRCVYRSPATSTTTLHSMLPSVRG